jgi:hypothetical protein
MTSWLFTLSFRLIIDKLLVVFGQKKCYNTVYVMTNNRENENG